MLGIENKENIDKKRKRERRGIKGNVEKRRMRRNHEADDDGNKGKNG